MGFARFIAVVVLTVGPMTRVFAQAPAPNPIDQSISQADDLQQKGQTEQARNIYESVLKTLRHRPASSQQGYVLNAIAQIHSATGEYGLAAQTAQEAADMYHLLGDAK